MLREIYDPTTRKSFVSDLHALNLIQSIMFVWYLDGQF